MNSLGGTEVSHETVWSGLSTPGRDSNPSPSEYTPEALQFETPYSVLYWAGEVNRRGYAFSPPSPPPTVEWFSLPGRMTSSSSQWSGEMLPRILNTI